MSYGPGTVIIEGPPKGLWPSDDPPLRLEINDLIKNQKQWSLYIQALSALQKVPQKDYESWFAISGIHGSPHDVWDNASPKPNRGYCAHGRPLFPTWHRAYLGLFEQTLHRHAVQIASQYTNEKEAWMEAANTLRSPYWDWAVNITPPPETYEHETLKIATKDGVVDYPNPLMAYNFNPPMAAPYDDKKTWRAPGMVDRLKSVERTIKNDVFKCLTLLKKWNDFSMRSTPMDEAPTEKPVANSLETLHDGLHLRVGGGMNGRRGYMGDPPVGSFDPMFWLHHTNVDRQTALWQAMNPKEWVSEGDIGLETDLIPFWNSQTTFHRSSGVPIRRWTEFGFNYPEFKDLVRASEEEIQKSIYKQVVELYGPDMPRGEAPQDYTDWFARVRSQTYSLRSSYTIFLFFGEPPESPLEWRTTENLVGVGEVFANPNPEDCPTCTENIDSINECIIYLTDALQEHELYDQPLDDIKSYIQKNLKWRVQLLEGTVIPSSQIPGWDIRVETAEISFDIPRGGKGLPEPTAGQPEEHIHF